eukprot:sb/3478476/
MENILEALGEQENKPPVMPVEPEENKQARRQRYRAQAKAWLGELKVAVAPAPVNSEPFVRAISRKYQLLCRVCKTIFGHYKRLIMFGNVSAGWKNSDPEA